MNTLVKPTTLRESALIYNEWGLSTLPIKHGDKKPLRDWKINQYERMSKNEILTTWQGQAEEPNIGLTGGLISDNLAIIDFDSPEGLNELMKDTLMKDIRENTLVSLSANKHLPHVYVKFPFPIQSSRINSLNLDVKSSGGYVVSPLSSLQDKKQLLLYTFERFKEPIKLNEDQSEYLIKRLALKRLPEGKFYFYGLNHLGYQYVKTGNYELINKHDRSSADQKILYVLEMYWRNRKKNPLERKQLIKEFIWNNFYKESKFFENKNNPDYYFEHSYNKCLAYIEERIIETNEIVQSYQNKIYSISNTTDQKVFSFLLNMATWQGTSENFFASVRTIGDHAGIAPMTASRSLKRLQESNLIQLQKIGTRIVQASSYEKPLASTFKILPIPGDLKESDPFDNDNLAHDAFRHNGLGIKGKILYDIIKGLEGCSLAEVIKEGNSKGVKSKNTVKSKVRKMIELEMLRIQDKKYYVNPLPDLDNASKILGTEGMREKNKYKFGMERAAYRIKNCKRVIEKGSK